jgi:hypothetical protein
MDLVLWFVAKSPFAIDQTRRTGQTVELTAARGSFADQEREKRLCLRTAKLAIQTDPLPKNGLQLGCCHNTRPLCCFPFAAAGAAIMGKRF